MEFNIYEKITNDFIAALENGVAPWQQPWFGYNWSVSHTNGKRYSLLNQLLLGSKGGEWLTFKQIQDEGGTIKKGCKAHYVVFWKFLPKYDTNEDGEKVVVGQYPILKFYNVWHISECDGIKEKYPTHSPKRENECISAAQEIFDNYTSRESENGFHTFIHPWNKKSCYIPKTDTLELPSIELFENSELFYSTLFHEMTHSTGHEKRLNRDGVTKFDFFGSEQYSKEELIAEIGAAFLCNQAGLDSSKTFNNSAAYIKSWASALKSDPKLIVAAASKAEQAVTYILTGEKPKRD